MLLKENLAVSNFNPTCSLSDLYLKLRRLKIKSK